MQDYMGYRTTWNTGLHEIQNYPGNRVIHGIQDFMGSRTIWEDYGIQEYMGYRTA